MAILAVISGSSLVTSVRGSRRPCSSSTVMPRRSWSRSTSSATPRILAIQATSFASNGRDVSIGLSPSIMPGNEPAGVAAGRSATGGCAIAVSPRAALSGRLPAVLTALTVRRACVRPMCREARCGGRDGPPLAGPSALPTTHADRSCWKQRAADSPPRTNRHGSIDAAHLHLLCRVHRHGHRLRSDDARRCPCAGRDRQREPGCAGVGPAQPIGDRWRRRRARSPLPPSTSASSRRWWTFPSRAPTPSPS